MTTPWLYFVSFIPDRVLAFLWTAVYKKSAKPLTRPDALYSALTDYFSVLSTKA